LWGIAIYQVGQKQSYPAVALQTILSSFYCSSSLMKKKQKLSAGAIVERNEKICGWRKRNGTKREAVSKVKTTFSQLLSWIFDGRA